MTDLRAAVEHALNALENFAYHGTAPGWEQAAAKLRAALAAPVAPAVPAEPVARVNCWEEPRYEKQPRQFYELEQLDAFRALPTGTHLLYAAPQPTPEPTLSEWAKTAKVGDVATVSVGIIPKRAEASAVPSAEPVAFDHDIGADRFTVVKGSFWWHIRIGDGTANVGKFHSRLAAEDVALKLLTAFRDGAYKQYHSAPQPAAVPQPLTEDQIAEMWSPHPGGAVRRPILGWGKVIDFARAIERAHGIGAAREQQP